MDTRGLIRHRIRTGVCWGSVCILLFIGQTAQARPQQQVPVIQPDAVTTPVTEANKSEHKLDINDGQDLYHAAERASEYIVQPGDTLWDVALEVGLDLATVPCAVAPTFQPDQPLVIGDRLDIPETTIRCHRVGPGETVATIAAIYQITPASIVAIPWNQLTTVPETTPLPAGIQLRIPSKPLAGDAFITSQATGQATDGSGDFLTWMLDQPVNTSPFLALAVGGPFADQLSARHNGMGRATVAMSQPGVVPENWPYGSGNFAWPLAGWLTQGYRYDHRAIDVAAPLGTVVTAADRGVVLRAGWNNQGYGLFVIIDHNIDYVTLYAHLSEIFVTEGQVVAQGDIIGKVGSTGNSTGPHLHFEIRDFGRLTNPLELLVE